MTTFTNKTAKHHYSDSLFASLQLFQQDPSCVSRDPALWDKEIQEQADMRLEQDDFVYGRVLSVERGVYKTKTWPKNDYLRMEIQVTPTWVMKYIRPIGRNQPSYDEEWRIRRDILNQDFGYSETFKTPEVICRLKRFQGQDGKQHLTIGDIYKDMFTAYSDTCHPY